MKSQLKRLTADFGKMDMRRIDNGHIQRLIAQMKTDGLEPKTVRNTWGVVSLIWQAALAQKYVDSLLARPKLPRIPKRKPRFFTLQDVANIIAASKEEHSIFYWLAAETGLRSGELVGLQLTDVDLLGGQITVSQSVWHGKAQSPKTDNATRRVAISTKLAELLERQYLRQKGKEHTFLFTSSTGSPWDMNLFRPRKFKPLLHGLKISHAGFHAFRHFNVSLLDSLRVPLKTIQERLGHALTGSFTLDVYGGQPDWERNVDAARLAGAAIADVVQGVKQGAEKLTPFCGLTAGNENGSQATHLEAAV
jgi:integrase